MVDHTFASCICLSQSQDGEQLAIVTQASGGRPNELSELITGTKQVPWSYKLGLGLADYLTLFTKAGVLRGQERDDWLPHLSLRELLAPGVDSSFVELVKPIEVALLHGWSTKMGGPKTVGDALLVALKVAAGDGILNPVRQLILAVRVPPSRGSTTD